MSKERVYIVLSHKHVAQKGSHPGAGKHAKTNWEVAEQVEFVSTLRTKHRTMSSAIGDYINKKMITGESKGMGEYDKFEEYVRTKYAAQMNQLDKVYAADRVAEVEVDDSPEVVVDQFGAVRTKTVFDPA